MQGGSEHNAWVTETSSVEWRDEKEVRGSVFQVGVNEGVTVGGMGFERIGFR